jgi:MutS domain V
VSSSSSVLATWESRHKGLGRQIERMARQLAALRRRDDQLATVRLGIVLVGLAFLFVAPFFGGPGLFFAVLAVFVLVFAAAAIFHNRLRKNIRRWELHQALKREYQARLVLDWENIPPPTEIAVRPEHPFQTDFDLTGPRSVHHLLDSAATQDAGLILADWLLATQTDLAVVSERQTLISQLRGIPNFREKLHVLARLVAPYGGRLHSAPVAQWLSAEMGASAGQLQRNTVILAVMAVVNACLFLLNGLGVPNMGAFLAISLLAYLGVYGFLNNRAEGLNTASLQLMLSGLADIFSFLEGYAYGNKAHLRKLCAPFLAAEPPSKHIRLLESLTAALRLRYNAMLYVAINLIVPWDMFFSWRLALARDAVREALPSWLACWHTVEALCSLASHADHHPEYVIPQISQGFVFEGCHIGHPLIDPKRRVCNDFTFEAVGQAAIITGSNMAGKSSFLRAVGVGLCMAYAGGVVCASQLKLGLFRPFACIRVSDSVIDGFSYFYAEVRRLRALMDALSEVQAGPLFFFIDEIFRGTNNRERLIGAQAFVQAIVGKRGVGVISTHDLELTKLADSLPTLANHHFQETVQEGQMHFDYRLRPGPCTTTNALHIMRMEGLPIPAG